MPGDSDPETIKVEPKVEPLVESPTETKESRKREHDDGDKKHNNNNNNNHQHQNKKNKKKNVRNKMKHCTWRPSDDVENSDYRGGKPLHEGSFANPAMREKFGITLPENLLPPPSEPSTSNIKEEEETTEPPPQQQEQQEEDPSKKTEQPRLFSKKKVAFLLGYKGSNYTGFQINNGQLTLQAVFELALLKSGLISPLNFGYPHKYGWSTSGRTDKGVHACAQVCSAKIQYKGQSMDEIRELINQHLPEDFRVLDAIRVVRKFCAKTGRSRVRYQYMIPSFCFLEREKLRALLEEKAPLNEERKQAESILTEEEVQEIQKHLLDFRISKEQKEALQSALEQYEGTHSFHNFTKGVSAKEARATRYIVSFNVEDPIIVNGIEWLPTQVIGQSFLLNQIRKMVSLAIDTVCLDETDNLISEALRKDKLIRTAVAPAQGLFLEMSFYDRYNERTESKDYDELNWHSEGTPAYHRWKQFRNDVLMDHVIKEEEREGNFIKYLYEQEFSFNKEVNYQLEGGNAKEDETNGSEEE